MAIVPGGFDFRNKAFLFSYFREFVQTAREEKVEGSMCVWSIDIDLRATGRQGNDEWRRR